MALITEEEKESIRARREAQSARSYQVRGAGRYEEWLLENERKRHKELEERRKQNGWTPPHSISPEECAHCGAPTPIKRWVDRSRGLAVCKECLEGLGKRAEEKYRLDGGMMRRPAWAASPSFSRCWSALEQHVSRSEGAAKSKMLLEQMAAAHVVTVTSEQAAALPSAYESTDEYGYEKLGELLGQCRVPFPFTFLDLGSVSLAPLVVDAAVLGGMCSEGSDGQPPVVVPFLMGTGPSTKIVAPVAVARDPATGLIGTVDLDLNEQFAKEHPEVVDEQRRVAVDAAERIISVLAWLQSVNVEVIETPMKPQEREREEAKGRRISLTVSVKQGKRKVSNKTGSRADYSHRFEVAGHYTHNFEEKPDGTPNKTFQRCAAKHPEKVMTIQGKPCVRWWTPPHVKGPVDKPLVPKIRVVQEAA